MKTQNYSNLLPPSVAHAVILSVKGPTQGRIYWGGSCHTTGPTHIKFYLFSWTEFDSI